jgi:hypothetical protein
VRQAVAERWTQEEISQVTGLSRARIAQIAPAPLLDLTGRYATTPPASIKVDLDEHRLTLLDALHRKLEADTRLGEAASAARNRDEPAATTATASPDELAEFIAAVEVQGGAREPACAL